MINKKLLVAAALALTLSISSSCTMINKPVTTNNPIVESKVDEAEENGVMKEYENMLDDEINIKEFISFVDKNIGLLSPENATKLVVKLEELQKNYFAQLEDKYYTTENQTILFEAFKPEFNLENLKSEKMENAEVKALLKETEELGYKVETAEGLFFPIIDYGFYEKYSANVTKDMKDYISIMAMESEKVPAKDAALVISWDEIFERLLNQEKFLDVHKDSVRFEEIKELYKKYVTYAIYGLNNTPLFDYEDNKMDDEAKAAYEKVIAKDSQFSQTMKEYYELIKNNGYKLTEEVKNYRDEIIKSMK